MTARDWLKTAGAALLLTACGGTAANEQADFGSASQASEGRSCKPSQPGSCGANGSCVQKGSGKKATYNCVCSSGYEWREGSCRKINPCRRDNGGCDDHASCSFDGSAVSCACREGYTGDGLTCARINPCDTNNGGCSADATCQFVEGDEGDEDDEDDEDDRDDAKHHARYFGRSSLACDDDEGDEDDDDAKVVCTCKDGFTGDGLTCSSADPCAGVTCGINALCEAGECVCDAGFVGDANTECTLPDPCDGVTCDANATCGGGFCTCNFGWTGDGLSCVKANPCDGVTCGTNATCEAGECVCDAGYVGDATVACSLPDPCDGVTCGANATCSEGFCNCDDGFVGDGQSCTQPDVCLNACGTGATYGVACSCQCINPQEIMDVNGNCAPADPCAAVTCGANATCGAGACHCDVGYTDVGGTCVQDT
jgi:hypothetical protein